ncbi:isoaspartyl peptidase/L-asparaginase-like [Acanthaster planci]|uniref:Isoaspartyl peptidase/L-asparaginase-like n=1 Tax=Acanthaster planci TaxID=133434 RepID=A0A8B7ZUD2_ACAPL|nr:isoaspartyl peptidase/L-asparaginase-like [Acanthaster planci]
MGVEEMPPEEFITEPRRKKLENHLKFQPAFRQLHNDRELGIDDHDTVGAVAVDAHGNVAAATSTGGITGQMIGRVGDSPLIGLSPQDAVKKALTVMKDRVDSLGGAIAVSKSGDFGHYFNTNGMIWASVQNGRKQV